MKIAKINGKSVPDGQTVIADHAVTTVEVQVRHLGTLDLDSVKRLLQAKYEVVAVKTTEHEVLVNSNTTVQDW